MRLASRSSQKRLGMTALPGNRNKSKTTLNFGELPTNRETFEMLARNFAVAVVLQLAATTAAWALPIADFTSSATRSEEHTSELQSLTNIVCRLLLEKKKKICKADMYYVWRWS